MKKLVQILILLLSLYYQVNAQEYKEYHFKFEITDHSELDFITKLISIDNVEGKTVYAYATQNQFDTFSKLDYKLELIDKDLPKSIIMATNLSEMESWNKYPTYEVYRSMLKNFESNFPQICKLDSIGTSNNGRKLYVLKLSDNVLVDESEPEFFYTSTMHGDETTGFILMLRLVDSLLNSYNQSAEITSLLNETEIYINPNANPDGTYYGGNNTVSDAIRSNGYVDLNRDFPDPKTGTNASYQPETQAMMDFAEARNFVISANFHGGSEVMNYPWDTWYASENLHADTDWFEKICTDYVTEARLINPSYMTNVTSDGVTHGATWYRVDGGRQDYMNFWHQCREVTIELSIAKVLASESLNNYWNYNKQSLINYIKECHYGIKGSVKNINNTPIKAEIFVIDHDDVNDSSMVFSNPDFGSYYRLVMPGTYNIKASAYGYISDTIYNVLVEENSSTVVNFILSSDPRKHILSGNIYDEIDNSPLDSVKITISNAPFSQQLTNENGSYFFEGVVEDTLDLVIQKSGFFSIDTSVVFSSTDTIFNFHLNPAKIENFEDHPDYKFNVQFAGNLDWTISSEAYDGNYSLKSGDITDGQSSILYFNETVTSNGKYISFFKKVSSEVGYDFLKFYIDGIEKGKWSGSIAWSQEQYYVSEGVYTFKWEYIKDGNTSTGSDCAWIDLISIPANDTNLVTKPSEIYDTLNIEETSEHNIFISNQGNISCDYTINNSTSWLSFNKTSNTVNYKETDTVAFTINASGLTPGYYNSDIYINKQNQLNDTVHVYLMIRDTISSELFPNQIIDTIYGGELKDYEIVINNNGVVSLDYNLEIENSNEHTWINLDTSSGTILLTKSDTILATVNTIDQGFGDFNCNIIFTEQDEDSDTIPVYIHILDTISFEMSPLNISDSLVQDSSVSYPIIISNNGISKIDYTGKIEFPNEPYNWISLNKESGFINTSSTDTIQILVNTSNVNAGSYTCNFIFSEKSGKTDTTIITIEVSELQSISNPEIIVGNLYPNPSKDKLMVDLFISENEFTLKVVDVLGNIITMDKIKTLGNSNLTLEITDYINISNLNPGIYYIQLLTNKSSVVRRFIKE